MTFLDLLDAELARAHGREHPLYSYWIQSTRAAVEHQGALIEAVSALSGVRLEGADALDLGCGTGAASIALARRGARHIYGLDLRLDGLGLRMARVRLQEEGVAATLLAADAGHLPLKAESVDFCFCDQVLEHVPDSAVVLAEIHRVLRPGAAAYLGAPNRLAPLEAHTGLYFAHWLPHPLCERYVKWRGRRAPGDLWDVHTRTYWTIRRQIRRQGFAVVGSLADFLAVWQRRWTPRKRRVATAYVALAKGLRLPLDQVAPAIALAVVKPRR